MNIYSHEEMIRRAHCAIMQSQHFMWLSQVLLLGKWQITDDKLPPRTDGFNIWYPKWRLDELWAFGGDHAIRYVVLHENLHKGLRHLSTWKRLTEINPMKANYAMDVVNNNMIAEAGSFVKMPDQKSGIEKFCVFHPEWAGLDTGEVWEKMSEQGNDGQGRGEGDDGHEQPAGYGDGDGEGEGDEGTDEDGNPNPSAGDIDAMMQSAVAQGLFMHRQRFPEQAGKIAALTAPKVDWRKALANWMSARQWGHDLTNWRRRSRRGHGLSLALPSRYAERTGRLVVAVDASGSIWADQAALTEFMSEVVGLAKLLKPAQVELIYWDTRIVQHETYLPQQYDNMINLTKPNGGGGTALTCVTEWLRSTEGRGVTGCVVLTDGELNDWNEGRWPCPVFVALNTKQPCPLACARIK
jgi:predicted metal-dependent peptidase